jgi:virginiamycin B lyase
MRWGKSDFFSCFTAGPDGNLWFTENSGNKIGRITTKGHITEFPTGTSEPPLLIAAGPDGKLWFTESVTCGGSGDSIARITTAGTVKVFPVPYNYPIGITAGPQTDMWFAGFGDFSGTIGKVATR